MLVKQISVFLENKSGRLAEVTKTLADKNIDISALSIADTADYGILRIIVNNPELAEETLRSEGFTVKCADVIAIAVDDVPGSLAKALAILNDKSISIEYMYAFVGKATDKALVILKVEEPKLAIDTLTSSGVKVVSSSEVYRL